MTISRSFKSYSTMAWVIVFTKLAIMTSSLIYVDRFNSDMVENIYWGQEWQMGYYKHPPMFAWVAEIWVQIFKNNMYFYHILTAVVFSLPTYLNFVLFKKILDEKKAILAVVLIEGIVYSNFVNICFNANTLLFIFHPIICIFAYKICEADRGKLLDWFLFGLFSGLALLTKYSSGLIILGCGLYIIYVKRWDFLKEVGFYIASGLCLIIFSGHIAWIVQNDYLTFKYLEDMQTRNHGFVMSRIYYTSELLKALLLNSVPFILAVLFIIKKPFLNKVKLRDKNSIFVLLISIIPFFLMSFIGGIWVKDQWMIAHVFLLPACFLWFINTELTKKRTIACIGIIIIFFVGVTAYLILVYKNSPVFSEDIYGIKISSQREAYIKLAKITNDKWVKKYGQKPKYICSKDNVAGLIAMYSRDYNVLHVIPNCNLYVSRWIKNDDLLREGIVVISKKPNPEHVQQILEDIEINPDLQAYQVFKKADLIEEIWVSDKSNVGVFVHFYKGIK